MADALQGPIACSAAWVAASMAVPALCTIWSLVVPMRLARRPFACAALPSTERTSASQNGGRAITTRRAVVDEGAHLEVTQEWAPGKVFKQTLKKEHAS